MKGSKIKSRFDIQTITSGSKTAFLVSGYKATGERVRRRFDTLAKANGHKHILEIEALNAEAVAPRLTRLSDVELRSAEQAFATLKPGGDLLEAVEHYNRTFTRPEFCKPMTEALEEFAKDSALLHHMRPNSIKAVLVQVRALARCEPQAMVHEFTRSHIDDFVSRDAVVTQRTKRHKLSSFFNWCLARGFCGCNPITGKQTAPERKIKRDGSPEILTLAEVRRLLAAALAVKGGVLGPYMVLHFFAGLRAEEIKKLDWDAVRLETGYIRVEGDVAKTSSARAVKIMPNLAEWLREYFPARPALVPTNFRKIFEQVRREAGLTKWTRDIVRHTAVSFHYGTSKLKAETAAWAGHSPQVLDKHYRGLVTDEEAQAFWSLTPSFFAETKVVSMAG